MERNINVCLPLTRPPQGTWPITQGPELGMEPATLWFSVGTHSTEPHQPGQKEHF